MKIQTYSAITNNHDPARTDEVKTFTDWEHFGSPLAAARFYKTHPHLLFPEADWTIWVDGNVELNVTPEELVQMARLQIPRTRFGVFAHSQRTTLLEEAKAIVQGQLDTQENVDKALDLAQRNGKFVTAPGLAMTMVLVRQNDRVNVARNERWWSLMCASSFRDQLTFPACFYGPLWPAVDFTTPNKYFTRTV